MNEIKTVLSEITGYFTGTDWYPMIKWPFWILLTTVAIGGIYTARFGKKTLICKGISGTLNLCGIYQAAIVLYTLCPTLRDLPYGLPFLLVSQDSITLADPIRMSLGSLGPILLQMMFLILLVDFVESLNPGGKTLLSWMVSQVVTVTISLSTYLVVVAGVTFLLPDMDGELAIIPVILALGLFLVMLCAKLIFTVVLESGNPHFKKFYDFFTANKVGSLLTVSSLSIVFSTVVYAALYLTENTKLVFASANEIGLSCILLLLLVAEYVFAMFYCSKKK